METQIKTQKSKTPEWAKAALIATLTFYLWYLISTLMLPLAEILELPTDIYLTFYKIVDFPPAMLGFIVCVSIISIIIVILEFNEQKESIKIFLTEGVSFMLYFIIPVVASILLIILLLFGIGHQIPSETKISFFLKDLFSFTSVLFVLTAILNLATRKIIKVNTRKDRPCV